MNSKKKITFYPEGVCSMMIEVTLNGDIIDEVVFTGAATATSAGFQS